MIVLDYDQAHEFVDSKPGAFWDGYEIVLWNKNHNGATNLKGLYRNNLWGIADRISVDDDGKWRLPNKYAIRRRS
jgi:hypothetical protein